LIFSLASKWANKTLLIVLDSIAVGLAAAFCFVDVETDQRLLAFMLFLFGFVTIGGVPLAAERIARADKTGVVFHHANFLTCFGAGMLQVIAAIVVAGDAKGGQELGVAAFRKGVWIPAAVVLGLAAAAAVGLEGREEEPVDLKASLNDDPEAS
jgi:hypothetical protein